MIKISNFVLLCCTIVIGCAQSRPDVMTPIDWEVDINYLSRKIEREFATFTPSVKAQFANEANELIVKLPELKNHQVACEIMRLMSLLKDGHTELNIGQELVGFSRVPISLYFFEGDLRVTHAHSAYGELVGAKVIQIGSYSLTEAFEIITSNMSADNDMEYLHAGPGYIILTEFLQCLGISQSPSETSFTFELENGEKIVKQLPGLDRASYIGGDWVSVGDSWPSDPLYLTSRGNYWFEYLPEEKAMYFHFARVNNQKGGPSIKSFTKELFKEIDRLKCEKLIIDFRKNNGGNYNLAKPLVDGIKERKWLNQTGKVWAVTGRTTFSASSAACIFLKKETKTLLIGEPGRTHPNLADNNEYMNLPRSGFLMEYTTKVKKHWPERMDLDRIPVDKDMAPTWNYYKAGKDRVLEYILNQ